MEIVWKCFSRPIPPVLGRGEGESLPRRSRRSPPSCGGTAELRTRRVSGGRRSVPPRNRAPLGQRWGAQPGGLLPRAPVVHNFLPQDFCRAHRAPSAAGHSPRRGGHAGLLRSGQQGKEEGEPSRRSPSPRTAEEQAFVATEGRGASPGSGGTLPARPGAAPGNKEVNRADSPLVFNYPGGLSVPLRAMKTLCSSLVLAFGSPRDVGW